MSEPLLCIVIHDVAPATRVTCERLLRQVDATAKLPVTLLVTPRWHLDPHDASFERWIGERLARGDEIALHGYAHRDEGRPRGLLDHARRRWYTRGEGEFSALCEDAAALRLAAGMRWFRERGWPLHGFVAPAWLMSAGSWRALDGVRFDWTATLSGVLALPQQRRLRSQALVYSSQTAWRRALSVVWNGALAHSQRHAPLLRLELHPGDASHARIRHAWTRVLARALHERTAVTMSEAVRRCLVDPYGHTASVELAVDAPSAAPASTSLG